MDFSDRSFQRSLSSSSETTAINVSGSMYKKGGNQHLRVVLSVYGGFGGHGTRISNSRHWVNCGNGDLLFGNEKTTMQNLNDRLASQLEKVQTLEPFNSKLELKIKRWYEKDAPSTNRDYSAYYRQIEEPKNQEVDGLHKQLGNTVNVQLNAVPGQSLSAIMDEMRQKYEALAQENLRKAKEQFKIQTETLQQQVTVNVADLKDSEIQLKKLSRTYQNLSLNLKSHLSMKDSLEHTLQDTKARYHRQLAAVQELLNTLKAQMMQGPVDS
ncbi:keratin, type I cytoskeletal 20 [Pteropus medius]|uniref:keratin, type I cytoskeletal 20-like n=1 Tax=Pteropus vampyrus TaxID=132908 RepID=UPI00196B828F|nr:keratin, type I cytoskeletal 20-like [Pteropus giganteus]